ncbi:hypothetical protein BLNAU_2635 [Blattamonas nauphoetae]|uniref:Uncharacterized protein n=1 Tax=Blattamonas nauphoetae TaxID=2049346 RepID=A0ABQ9WQ34_9EUKA|nr:hypothetical protein BLNAU_23656 [Blattamonas nauphoetae]KAK2962392.1 hypothetical protein BLNAU_2635 [Blattamonas nauphoetae]
MADSSMGEVMKDEGEMSMQCDTDHDMDNLLKEHKLEHQNPLSTEEADDGCHSHIDEEEHTSNEESESTDDYQEKNEEEEQLASHHLDLADTNTQPVVDPLSIPPQSPINTAVSDTLSAPSSSSSPSDAAD